MIYSPTIISILEVLIVTVPVLLTVAFVTVAERKTMASMQRRIGPNIVGYYGLLQAFADALKLLLKEYISPTQANLVLFFLGPVITLIFSLLGYAVIPYGPGITLWDFSLGILYMLAVSSLATYGILLAGWSANSKYAFLGSLRSTAQLISYELILSSAILLVILLTGSLNLTVNIEAQRAIWFLLPLLPVFIIFYIGSVAETNRPPFDLAEAESELVSGFMTEHAAVIFVFFFLAEYASIVLICILNAILFIGGYLMDYTIILNSIHYIFYMSDYIFYLGVTDIALEMDKYVTYLLSVPLIEGILFGLTIGIKSCIMIFVFIWVRASFPRIRFDQLMSFSWTILLPVVIAFIILIPCLIYGFEVLSSNISLFWLLPIGTKNYCKGIFHSVKYRLKCPVFWTTLFVSLVVAALVRWTLFDEYSLDNGIIAIPFFSVMFMFKVTLSKILNIYYYGPSYIDRPKLSTIIKLEITNISIWLTSLLIGCLIFFSRIILLNVYQMVDFSDMEYMFTLACLIFSADFIKDLGQSAGYMLQGDMLAISSTMEPNYVCNPTEKLSYAMNNHNDNTSSSAKQASTSEQGSSCTQDSSSTQISSPYSNTLAELRRRQAAGEFEMNSNLTRTEPVTAQVGASTQTESQSADSQSANFQNVTHGVVSSQSTSTQPVSSQSTSTQPVSSQSTSTQPPRLQPVKFRLETNNNELVDAYYLPPLRINPGDANAPPVQPIRHNILSTGDRNHFSQRLEETFQDESRKLQVRRNTKLERFILERLRERDRWLYDHCCSKRLNPSWTFNDVIHTDRFKDCFRR